MGEPRFRWTVAGVALLHVLAIGWLLWWSLREVPKPQVTWMSPAQFLPPEEEEDPQPTPTPTPTPKPTPTPTTVHRKRGSPMARQVPSGRVITPTLVIPARAITSITEMKRCTGKSRCGRTTTAVCGSDARKPASFSSN